MKIFGKIKEQVENATGGAIGCTCTPAQRRDGGCQCDFLDPTSDPLGH